MSVPFPQPTEPAADRTEVHLRYLAYFRDAGYAPHFLRAFDLFPMTHHMECVAILQPAPKTP